MISLIAAMDERLAIGRNNALPWHLPDDLRHFKRLTLGKPVLMGRKTFESLGCRPLPGRRNLILTRRPVPDRWPEQIETFSDLDDALNAARAFDPLQEVMIIGGSEIYAQTLPRAQRLYLTRVLTQIDSPDAWFPAWSPERWQRVHHELRPADERHPWPFVFETWRRIPHDDPLPRGETD